MKKILAYFTVIAAIVAAGCTNFGDENQLSLGAAPEAVISDVVAEADGDSITFNLAPSKEAGYYAWVVVKSELVDSTLQADRILKKLVAGVANGLINYTDKPTSTIGVGKLTPFTVYQIYAVTSSKDGVVSKVENFSIRTLDDGSKPTPKGVAIADTIVTLTFHEPVKLGTSKVFVSYFAKNTVSGANPLVIAAGYEDFNPQNIEVAAERLSVSGNKLIVELPNAPAGVYASITYEEGAVKDLDGNLCSTYTRKADTLQSGAPSRGITVRVPTKSWALQGEFEEVNPDTVAAFTDWSALSIPAIAKEGVVVKKKIATVKPTVVYAEIGKSTKVEVKTWGVSTSGVPVFKLPEAPARGAVVDLNIPAGAFEDVYGNTSLALDVKGNYLYSYGYTLADILGTYDIAMNSYWDGALTETGIIVDKAADSDTILIKNLLSAGSLIKAVFDPVLGKITLEDMQLLVSDANVGLPDLQSIYFVNAATDGAVVFNVPSPAKITSTQMWGYYMLPKKGFYDAFTASTWTRKSTDVTIPQGVKSKFISKKNILTGARRSLKK
jgi:hypothetical protein